jgi:PHD/YefM family antitoxin component YafN of YafNO toxin-antitoxin module
MEKVNALELRQSLGKIIAKLQKNGEPILLERGRQAAAVIITLEDFRKRFVEKDADEQRRQLQEKILKLARPSKFKRSAEEVIRQLRDA